MKKFINNRKKLYIIVFLLGLLFFITFVLGFNSDEFQVGKIENLIFTGDQGKYHVQGVALDKKNGYIYYSYTDKIVKSDLKGNIIGSISGFVGHIGCIAYNEKDENVYASLEYKHDAIGNFVADNSKERIDFDDGFYIAIFDVDKIIDGDYEISQYPEMIRTVHLSEVLKDFKGKGKNINGDIVDHKYGCSGIDGLCIAPLPGGKNKDLFLYVAYGIYSDVNRNDNDHQVILCYNIDDFSKNAEIFDQNSLHRNGPETYYYKFFVYTGNTTYGIQNMAYDESLEVILMACYPGQKKEFDNYSLFAIDLTKRPVEKELKGTGESGLVVDLKGSGVEENKDISGWNTELGQCGMCTIGDGYFYLAESLNNKGRYSANIHLYYFDLKNGFKLVE